MKIAGDYLTTARQVQVPANEQAGIQFALQPVVQWLLAAQQLGQGLELPPQVGPCGDLEGPPGMAADAAPEAGLVLDQQQVVEPHRVGQVADEQAAVVGVVDAQVQDEFLLVQPGLDRLDLDQVHLGLAPVAAAPAGATCQQRQHEAEDEQAGQGDHAQLPM